MAWPAKGPLALPETRPDFDEPPVASVGPVSDTERSSLSGTGTVGAHAPGRPLDTLREQDTGLLA
jgi:hypothetical protein